MTIPHYGKREAGALTAASPGDTLHFAFGSYNDSGDSEVLTGFAVTDIEVIKDGSATVRATDSGYSLISDTGMVGDRAGLYRFRIQLFNTADDASFYAAGSWYQVFVDSVTVDGKTVRFWCGSFEIGRQRVDVRELAGDTGAANWLRSTFLNGFSDTGVQERFARIQSDVDTGLRVHIDDSDTGLKDTISDLDTGLRGILVTAGVNVGRLQGDTGAAGWLRAAFANGFNDTGITNRFDRVQFELDTGLRAHMDDSDTGLKDTIADLDTGLRALLALQDTGFVANAVWNALRSQHVTAGSFGESDTGINQRLGQIQSDVDTGLRAQISDVDTGLHDTLSDYDTGLRALLTLRDTGAVANAVWGFATRALTAFSHDTGVADTVWKYGDTGSRTVNMRKVFGDTGAANQLQRAFADGFNDTGVNDRLGKILADTDTGIQSGVNVSNLADTGLVARLDAIKNKTDSLTFSVAGQVDANVKGVNDVDVNGSGTNNDPWGP
jgi:hypothetical protein